MGNIRGIAPSNANANSRKEFLVKGVNVQVIYGIPSNKASVRYRNDCEKQLFKLRENGKVIIGGSGRLIWEKGVDFFLQVCALTIKKCPEVHFVWLKS